MSAPHYRAQETKPKIAAGDGTIHTAVTSRPLLTPRYGGLPGCSVNGIVWNLFLLKRIARVWTIHLKSWPIHST